MYLVYKPVEKIFFKEFKIEIKKDVPKLCIVEMDTESNWLFTFACNAIQLSYPIAGG